jgi:hypothetical protein
MGRRAAALGLALAVLAVGVQAQAKDQAGDRGSDRTKDLWGALGAMAGHTFVAVHDGSPQTVVDFRWDKPGQVLVVNGLTSMGQAFKAEYRLDPATGRIDELNWRGAKTYRSVYRATPDGFVESGDQDGVQVRRIFRRTSATTFDTTNQSQIKGVWRTTRQNGTFILASPEWVKTLGWTARKP